MDQPLIAVIGAGPGIGLAIGKRFAREGFRVALVTREDAAGLREQLGTRASEALVLAAELAEPGALEAALGEIVDTLGWPEVLVYNASRGEGILPSALPVETLMHDFRVNAASALACAQWALPAMREWGRGTILFTGGGLALAPKAGEASLSVGKGALRSLALCLAQELAPEGIHAATVAVSGFVQQGSAFNPDFVAEAFWQLHREPSEAWRSEIVLKP